ncbi:MAG: YqhA family protein [Slackia sp.]|nr:YqhA family protein [Slackia sp.]
MSDTARPSEHATHAACGETAHANMRESDSGKQLLFASGGVDDAIEAFEQGRESRRRHRERKLVGYSRFIAIVPSIGLFIASMALTISTLLSTIGVTFEAACGRLEMQDMLVDYIEFADFFLLSVVLYIMSVGLYSLFVDDGIEMPSWLQIHDLDDLKEKLVGVVVVVMGVYFLGLLIHGTEPVDLLLTGLGIGAVVLTLTYFVRHVMAAHKEK